MTRSKIICTVGPSVDSEKKIAALVQNGMSVVRMNCSHGDTASRQHYLQMIRRVEKQLKRPIAVMLDLQGPKLRVGDLPEPFILRENDTWRLSGTAVANAVGHVIPLSFQNLGRCVAHNGFLFMDDGLIKTQVTKLDGGDVWVKVIHGGILESRKGINIPFYKGRTSVLSAKDKTDLAWGLAHDVDFVALSFVRHASDIAQLKKLIGKLRPKSHPLVIAKIEKPEAVDEMDAIIKESDGILVARGDLGIELPPEKVPVVQKQLIERCRFYKKPIIVATQMLDSMRHNPVPTRAEVSDVATAIYSGTDAVLLTGETSGGKYPVEACAMMHKIIREVEAHMIVKNFRKAPEDFGVALPEEAVMFNLMQMADDVQAKAIVVLTKQGTLTKILSKLHPKQPIFAIASNQMSYRQLNLFWGVYSLDISEKMIDERIQLGTRALLKRKVVHKGDRFVCLYRDYQSANLNIKIIAV